MKFSCQFCDETKPLAFSLQRKCDFLSMSSTVEGKIKVKGLFLFLFFSLWLLNCDQSSYYGRDKGPRAQSAV